MPDKKVTTKFVACSAILLVLLFSAFTTEAAVWTVENGESIQDAINSASPGDTIQVEPGTYEEYLEVNKRLTIEGTGEDVIILAPGTDFDMIRIPSSDVTVKNLVIDGEGTDKTAIGIWEVWNVQIRNCFFRNLHTGIWISCDTMNVVVANNTFENVLDYGIDNETDDNTSVYFRCLAIGNRFTFDPTADASSTAYYANSRKGNIALFNTFEDYAGHKAISTPESTDIYMNATGNYWGEGAEGSGIDAACSGPVLFVPWSFADAAGHTDYQLVVPGGSAAVFDVGASEGITISIEDITTLPPPAFPLALAAYGDESPCPTTVQEDNPNADSYTAYFILQDVEPGPTPAVSPTYRMTARFPKEAIGKEADLDDLRLYIYQSDSWVDVTDEAGFNTELDGDNVLLIVDDFGDPGPFAITAGNGDTSSSGCSSTGAASIGFLLLAPMTLFFRRKK